MRTATRYHDISVGHRVFGHENKCAHSHGHNYRIHFTLAGELDKIGRILDFAMIKSLLCEWLEINWDHKTILWEKDPWLPRMKDIDPETVGVSFNPTAENIAEYLVKIVGPHLLEGTGATLIQCTVEETRKCSASFYLNRVHQAWEKI